MLNALGLLASLSTVVWTTLSAQHEKEKSSSSSSRGTGRTSSSSSKSSSFQLMTWSPFPSSWSPEMRIFVSGIAFTLGIQHVFRWFVRKGYYQTIKFMFLSPLYNGYLSCLNKREIPLRLPVDLLRLLGQVYDHHPTANGSINSAMNFFNFSSSPPSSKDQSNKQQQQQEDPELASSQREYYQLQTTQYGSVTRLLTPDTTSNFASTTDTLHISIVSIHPYCEMPSQLSPPCAEFYYVLSGSGLVSQQGIIETMYITAGQAFVIDPFSMRWISCTKKRLPPTATTAMAMTTDHFLEEGDEDADSSSNDSGSNDPKEPLVLLRVTDGGSIYSQPQWNQIRLDPVYTEKLFLRHHQSASSSSSKITRFNDWMFGGSSSGKNTASDNSNDKNTTSTATKSLQTLSEGLFRVQQMAAEYTANINSSNNNNNKQET